MATRDGHRVSPTEHGCVGLVVDAKPEAVEFYPKFGFFDLELEAGELGGRPTPRLCFS